MKIHYFQRYHGKENVATANTMLLLARLYSYSSDKFFHFLKELCSKSLSEDFEPELVFNLQERAENSVPDATITQKGFKIVVETKLSDWFYKEQLLRHLKAFEDASLGVKVLMTLAPEPMEERKREVLETIIKEYNDTNNTYITHINTTFDSLAKQVEEVIDEARDYEMWAVLQDYWDYCCKDNLLPVHDSWKYMRMQLAGTTFDFNCEQNVFFCPADRGFRPFDYLGLYKQKSVCAIGKVSKILTAVETRGELVIEPKELAEDYKDKVASAIAVCEKKYGYQLRNNRHRYFFVEKFCPTNFKKISHGGAMGPRNFDLTEYLGVTAQNQFPTTEEIAEKLKNKTWQ